MRWLCVGPQPLPQQTFVVFERCGEVDFEVPTLLVVFELPAAPVNLGDHANVIGHAGGIGLIPDRLSAPVDIHGRGVGVQVPFRAAPVNAGRRPTADPGSYPGALGIARVV